MASRVVEYIFQLVDRFSPNAAKMAQAATNAEGAIHRMGAKYAIAERRMAEAQAAAYQTRVMHLENAKKQYQQYTSFKEKTLGALDNTFMAMATFGMGGAAVRGMDHFLEKSASVQELREKLMMAGQTSDEIKSAQKRAFSLSGKYKNMSGTEILELINDARANLTGSFDDIVEHIEPFVKLGSFFKAYDGGKHSGKHKALLGELNAAMQSGELLGKISPKELAKHTDMLGAMKVVYGDRLNIGQYLTAQRNTNSALMMMDDKFKYGQFPALIQSLGPRAGTGLATLVNKTVSGIMLRDSSIAMLKKLDLLDDSTRFNSKGKVDKSTLRMRDSALAASNPFEWTINTLLPKIEKVVKGLNAKEIQAGIAEAKKTGNADRLEKALHKIDQGELGRVLGQLVYDRTAKGALEEFIMQSGKIVKDTEMLDRVVRDFNRFKTYAKAKQSVSSQMDNLMAIIGTPIMEFADRRLQNLANTLEKVWKFFDRHPNFTKWASGTVAVGLAALTAALGLGAAVMGGRLLATVIGSSAIGRFLTLGLIGGSAAAGAGLAGAAAASKLGMLSKLGSIALKGSIVFAGYESAVWIYNNWKKLGQFAANPLKFNIIFPEAPDWVKALVGSVVDPQERFRQLGLDPKTAAPPASINEEPWLDRIKRWWKGPNESPSGPHDADGIPRSEAQKEVTVRTRLDPITMTPIPPAPIRVEIHGTVNGPLNGSGTGAVQFQSNAPRGESMKLPSNAGGVE